MARIAGVNIPQNKLVHVGLTYIYGIGDKFSYKICNDLEIKKSAFLEVVTRLWTGRLNFQKIQRLNHSISCS